MLKSKTLLTFVILILVSVRVAAAQAVRVVVLDETSSRPLAARAEIWVRGHGSFWLKPAMKELETWGVGTLRIRKIGISDTLFVYPDARVGQEIAIAFTVNASMCRNGCPRDAIVVTFLDTSVEVAGQAVTKKAYPRR